jgi:hypothetical protein
VRRAALALALALAAPLLSPGPAAAAGPFYYRGPEGALQVSGLPDVLSRPDVRPHLTTGLTTGLVITLSGRDGRGGKVRGAGRVDIRWEPWDEVFYTTTVSGDGRVRRETLASFDRLAAWWSALELTVLAAAPAELSTLQVELSVVPFSQSEQLDAQRWFSSALGPETADDPSVGRTGDSRLSGLVDILIATSIQRRSIVRFQWPAQPRPAATGQG